MSVIAPPNLGSLLIPGTDNNWAHTPHNALLNVPGDWCTTIDVAHANWLSANLALVWAKWTSHFVSIHANTVYTTWVDAVAQRTMQSTAIPGTVNGQFRKIAVVHDVDNDAGGNTMYFLTSNDGITWTQFSSVTQHFVTAPVVASSVLNMASWSDGINFKFNGNIREVTLRNGKGPGGTIGGTKVLHLHPKDFIGVAPAAPSLVMSSGQTLTLVRSVPLPQLAVVPTVPIAYYGEEPILGAYYGEIPVTTIYSNE